MRTESGLKRIGMIGAGGFAVNHLQMLVQRGADNGMMLAAVADPTVVSESTAATLSKHSVQRYDDYEEMLRKESLDGVFISTPIPMHYAMTASALRNGLHVYLEKPPVTSLAQLQDLIQLDPKPSVQVGFNMNSWPVVRRTLQRIRRGDFGTLHSVRVLALWPRTTAYYSRASWAGKLGTPENPILDGPATNAMSHYVQLACSAAAAAGGGAPIDVQGEFYRAREIESYDTCSLAGRFVDGPKFSVVMSHAAGPGQTTALTLETDRGTFAVDNELFSRIGTSRLGNSLGHSHLDFGRLVNGEMERPRVTLTDCVNFLEIISQGLAASGGITTIPAEYVSRVGEGGEELYAVRDLRETAKLCSDSFQTFSTAGAPWREASLMGR